MTRLAQRTYIALLHHPVYDRTGRIVATAITNLDIHDLARSSRTFGLGAYYLVTPLERQRALAQRIISHWGEEEGPRAEALKTVRIAAELAEVVEAISRGSEKPVIVATAAKPRGGKPVWSPSELRDRMKTDTTRPLLLLFGTGWGLSEQVIEGCDALLEPIVGQGDYNHLSVRSAAAIMLDRLLGERQ